MHYRLVPLLSAVLTVAALLLIAAAPASAIPVHPPKVRHTADAPRPAPPRPPKPVGVRASSLEGAAPLLTLIDTRRAYSPARPAIALPSCSRLASPPPAPCTPARPPLRAADELPPLRSATHLQI